MRDEHLIRPKDGLARTGRESKSKYSTAVAPTAARRRNHRPSSILSCSIAPNSDCTIRVIASRPVGIATHRVRKQEAPIRLGSNICNTSASVVMRCISSTSADDESPHITLPANSRIRGFRTSRNMRFALSPKRYTRTFRQKSTRAWNSIANSMTRLFKDADRLRRRTSNRTILTSSDWSGIRNSTRYAMIARIGVPWSMSRRLRPGTSSFRESKPNSVISVAWTSVT